MHSLTKGRCDIRARKILAFELDSNFKLHQNTIVWKSKPPQWTKGIAMHGKKTALWSVLSMRGARIYSSPHSLALSKSRLVQRMQSLIKHTKDERIWGRRKLHSQDSVQASNSAVQRGGVCVENTSRKWKVQAVWDKQSKEIYHPRGAKNEKCISVWLVSLWNIFICTCCHLDTWAQTLVSAMCFNS